MNQRRLRLLYVIGIAFNGVALATAVSSGATLYAVTFGVIMSYLAIRYWMVAQSDGI